MAKNTARKIRVTLKKSIHGRLPQHRRNAAGLGLRRRHQTVELAATPQVLGMVEASRFMFEVEEVAS